MTNFDQLYERTNTDCLKWDLFKKRYKMNYKLEDTSGILPMWVADMDFAVPAQVIDAIKERLEHPIFGYSYVSDNCKKAIQQWFIRRHNWEFDTEHILFHQGVVPALATIIETFSEENDKICIQTPVYYPFFAIPKANNRQVVENKLIWNNGTYSIDFEDLEKQFQSGVKIFLLCSPHNPGGVVWSKEDLEKMVQLCIQYDVLLVSDEIHADLILEGYKHIPTLTVDGADKAKIITCVAPTKTFNIAGIHSAMMIVPDSELRKKLIRKKNAQGRDDLNILAAVATEAAYLHGDEWLDKLLQYISRNMDYVVEQLNQLEGVNVTKPQATYLMWIDYRGTGISEEEMMQRLLVKGKLALDPGTKYSETGRGFLRINVACPFETVKDGVERFKKALEG